MGNNNRNKDYPETVNESQLIDQGLRNKIFMERQRNIYKELSLIEELKHQANVEIICNEYDINRAGYLMDHLERVEKLKLDLEERLRNLRNG